MFGIVVMFVIKDLAPALRDLVASIRSCDHQKRIEALAAMEVAAEISALKTARKKLKRAGI